MVHQVLSQHCVSARPVSCDREKKRSGFLASWFQIKVLETRLLQTMDDARHRLRDALEVQGEPRDVLGVMAIQSDLMMNPTCLS